MGLVGLVVLDRPRVYLQIQVVADAPFKVLLGKPFFDITSCTEISRAGGTTRSTSRPYTGTPYVFASRLVLARLLLLLITETRSSC